MTMKVIEIQQANAMYLQCNLNQMLKDNDVTNFARNNVVASHLCYLYYTPT